MRKARLMARLERQDNQRTMGMRNDWRLTPRGCSTLLGVLCASWALSSPAWADAAKGADDTLQVIGAFADLTGQSEVGDSLSIAGTLIGGSSEDADGVRLDTIDTEIRAMQTKLTLLSQQLGELGLAQNVDAIAASENWNNDSLSRLNGKMGLLGNSIDEVLLPLKATPPSLFDALALGTVEPFGNQYHVAALGVAKATMAQADDFLDVRYLPYGGGCLNGAGSTPEGLVGECSPNPLWVMSLVLPQQVPDRNADGTLHSYGTVDGTEVLPAFRFRPEVGMATYIAELRTAVAAMEIDLEGQDMSGGFNGKVDAGKVLYFQAAYAHMFDRHIAFLTYFPAPDDPTPDGLGSKDYYRYSTHTNGQLMDAYEIAMRRTEPGVSPQTWELMDRTREMLIYAQAHGTLAGWSYTPPAYVLAALGTKLTNPPAGGLGVSCVILQNCAARAIVSTGLVGVDAAGAAFQINQAGAQLTLAPTPLWQQSGVKYLLADSDSAYFALAQDGFIYVDQAGRPAQRGRSFLIEDMLSKSMFGGGNGTVYFIENNGDLYWTRNTVSGAGASVKIGNGWGGMRQVVGGGYGVIYAVAANGDLLRYKHIGYYDGAVKWSGPTKVAKGGWDAYVRVAAGLNGVLFGVRADGSADLYQDLDFNADGSDTNDPPVPGSAASRLKGPFRTTGVDLTKYPLLVGQLSNLGTGAIK